MATQDGTEHDVHELCTQGAYERAATLALEAYGRELLRFLIARLGVSVGEDAFSQLLEDFWRGLPGFEWRGSLRTWLYTLARHAAARDLRGARHKHERAASPSTISAFADRVRTSTAAHLQTETKDRFRALREQLPESDQTLLLLRIDSKLSWKELACVMSESQQPLTALDSESAAARLRQRFHAAKERLRKAALAEGLITPRETGR
jgi:RNA polymerase sigma-70 factor, ECF subfamily